MIEDKELLEKAASAALPGWEWNGVNQCIEYIPDDSVYYRKWRPLDDDGDALRLAVDLKIQISIYKENSTVWAHTHKLIGYSDQGNASYQASELVSEKFSNDPYEATRRAIVRAAALTVKQKETDK